MEWPYSLSVDLNEEQQASRRRMLDAYGQFAQLSILLLPLFYQLSRALRLLSNRVYVNRLSPNVKERQSPTVSAWEIPDSSSGKGSLRWLRWMFKGEIAQGWGTWQQLFFAFLWASWLLVLVIRDTGDDYLHVTKRFGIIAASQIPLHYILAMKAWSPIQHVTRMSHEELNPYHRILGRIISGFMICHAMLYTNFYIQKGFLFKRIQDRDVILGLSAASTAIVLFTTALGRIRHYNYRLFFYLHVLLSMIILPILYFHVSHLRLYIVEAAAIYVLLIVQRNVSRDSVNATISRCKNTNLVSVSASLGHLKLRRSYAPGQHVYLTFPGIKEKLRLNPFTIANRPNQRRTVEIVARVLDGTTALLDELASKPQPIHLNLEGPYGGAKYFPDFLDYDSILLLAGGVGATFTLPIFQNLLELNDGNRLPPKVKFVWAVKHRDDAAWGVEKLSLDSRKIPESFELYLTGNRHDWQAARSVAENDSEDIEMREREGLLNEITAENSRVDLIMEGKSRSSRPNLGKLVDDAFSHPGGSKVAVLVCGPTGMGSALWREVSRWVGSGRDVFWHNEEFGW